MRLADVETNSVAVSKNLRESKEHTVSVSIQAQQHDSLNSMVQDLETKQAAPAQ